jgi:hypothetical protein
MVMPGWRFSAMEIPLLEIIPLIARSSKSLLGQIGKSIYHKGHEGARRKNMKDFPSCTFVSFVVDGLLRGKRIHLAEDAQRFEHDSADNLQAARAEFVDRIFGRVPISDVVAVGEVN